MGFGPVWRKQGGATFIPITAEATAEIAYPDKTLVVRGNGVKIKTNSTTRVVCNATGIGVFDVGPVAQQDKQADLNVGVSGLEDTQTFCNTLQERLAAYGWFA